MGHQVGMSLSQIKVKNYILVAIEYFSKWIEAKALASTTKFQVIKFIKSIIVARYGISSVLISDNGPAFVVKKLR